MGRHFNPYEILRISNTASETEIRHAYYHLSRMYHPDKNKGYEEHFKDIVHAYEMLTKPENFTRHSTYTCAENNADNDIILYEDDRLGCDNFPLLSNEKNKKYEDYKNYKEDSFWDSKELLKIKQSYFSSDLSNFIKPHYNYNSSHLTNFKEDEIAEIIQLAEERYKDIPHLVTGKAFLWEAKKEGSAPLYLFGTCHIPATNSFKDRFDDVLDQLIESVDVVFTEIKMNMNSNSKIDEYISIKAHKMGKELKPLENSVIIDSTMPPGYMKELIKIAKKNRGERTVELHTEELYLTGACPSSHELNVVNKKLPLIDSAIKRNFFWMSTSILPQTNQEAGSYLVAAGAAHNVGIYGLPNLLANEGYTVKPLIKTAPAPKHAIFRNPAFFDRATFFQRVVDKEAASRRDRGLSVVKYEPDSKTSPNLSYQ